MPSPDRNGNPFFEKNYFFPDFAERPKEVPAKSWKKRFYEKRLKWIAGNCFKKRL
jgi:hypothetical protein